MEVSVSPWASRSGISSIAPEQLEIWDDCGGKSDQVCRCRSKLTQYRESLRPAAPPRCSLTARAEAESPDYRAKGRRREPSAADPAEQALLPLSERTRARVLGSGNQSDVSKPELSGWTPVAVERERIAVDLKVNVPVVKSFRDLA